MSDQKIQSNNRLIEILKNSYQKIGENKLTLDNSLSENLSNKLLPSNSSLSLSVSPQKDMFEYNTKLDLTYRDSTTNSKYKVGSIYFDNISQHRDEEIKGKVKTVIQSNPQLSPDEILNFFSKEKEMLVKSLSEKEIKPKLDPDKMSLALSDVNNLTSEISQKLDEIKDSIVDHYLRDKIYEQKKLYQFQQVFRLGNQNQQLLEQRYRKELEKMYPKPSEGAKERLRRKINGNMGELTLTFDDFSINIEEPKHNRKNPSMPPQQNTYKPSNAMLTTSRYQLVVNRQTNGSNRFKLVDINTGEEKRIDQGKAFDMVEKMWQLNKKQRKELRHSANNGYINFKDLEEKRKLSKVNKND